MIHATLHFSIYVLVFLREIHVMDEVLKVLANLGIHYDRYDHQAFFTCDDGRDFMAAHPGGHCKNLFLRNKKGTQHYLVIVPEYKRLDLLRLGEFLGESQMSFASAARLQKYLQVTPGSVSPFGLIYDQERHVKVLIDGDLWQQDPLYFHPNSNTTTLMVSRSAMTLFFDSLGVLWQIVNLPV